MLVPPVVVVPVTFESEPGVYYLPASEAASALGWSYSYDPVTELARVGGHSVDPRSKRLWNRQYLVRVKDLVTWGAKIEQGGLASGTHRFRFHIERKRVVVDVPAQTLTAYEGAREVIHCSISTGGPGRETPRGRFTLGAKDLHHVSSIYHTPMPWSVHVTGGIFVHGSEWFSDRPASHGCIRLEMHGETNWAEWFYNWAKPGVPILIR